MTLNLAPDLELLVNFSEKDLTFKILIPLFYALGFEKVDYHGFVDYKLLSGYYMQADVGIVNFLPDPNHINAMPNKLFEYMAAGLPIISSNFPLWKGIVEGNQCGITVNPLKPEDIAKAIVCFHNNPKLRKKMGKNGRQSVIEKYNWDKENKKLFQVYEALSKWK